MIAKYLATAMLGTALMCGSAFAQSSIAPSTSASQASAGAINAAQNLKGTWRVSKLVGLNVYNDSNEKLGDINEILVDNSGKVSAVILGVGGFLGVGEQSVAVNFDQLKWVNEPVRTSAAGSDTGRPTPIGAPSSSTTTGSAINSGSMGASASRDNWYPDHAVMSATKDQLKAMPAFKYSDYSK